MATFDQITAVRLAINDPADVIDFESVDTLPASLEPQRAYFLTTNSRYYIDSPGAPVRLYVSDAQISSAFSSGGQQNAVYEMLKQIIAKLGREIILVSDKGGADSTEYTSLRDLSAYYERLLARAEEELEKSKKTSTGRYGKISRPQVAGGDF